MSLNVTNSVIYVSKCHELYVSRYDHNSIRVHHCVPQTLHESTRHELYISRYHHNSIRVYHSVPQTLHESKCHILYVSRHHQNSIRVYHYVPQTLHESKCHELCVSRYHQLYMSQSLWNTNSTWVEMPRTLRIYISLHLSVSLSLNSHELYMSRNATDLMYLHITTPLCESIIEFPRTLHESKCHEPDVSTYHHTSPWDYHWILTNSNHHLCEGEWKRD